MTRDRETLAGYVQRWLDYKKPRLEPSAHIRYCELARLHVVPQLGRYRLVDVRREHLRRLYDERLASGLSKATVQRIHRFLHAALQDAVAEELVVRNVCDTISPPKPDDVLWVVLTPAQARHLLDTVRGERYEALYVIALTTGMRQGELLALRWQEVDLDAGRIAVVRTIQRIRNQGLHEGAPKSARGRRHVQLMPLGRAALHRQRACLDVERATAPRWTEQDLVFPNTVGKPMEGSNLDNRIHKPLMARLGLPPVRFHDLRHSCASLLLALGVHPKVVQELLGHAAIGTTLGTYSHTLPTLQDDAMGRLQALLRPPEED